MKTYRPWNPNNPRVTHEAILDPHIRATCERAWTCDEVLALHDTTQFEFKRPDPDAEGHEAVISEES